jgi:chromosome segregation ATPase
MPTQEERIAALEQKTAAHIQEMDENFTIMVGVIRHQGQDIKRIFQRLETIDESLDSYNQRLETVNQQLETMDGSLHIINQRLDKMEQSLNTYKQQLDEHTSLLTQILERLT